MKSELIAKLQELLGAEDVLATKREVKNLRDQYRDETQKERDAQQKVYDETEREEGAEVPEIEFVRNELDDQFYGLCDEHKEKVGEAQAKRDAIRKENLKLKEGLCEEFEKMVDEEENIGKAFSVFNAITEKWKTVGEVPQDQYNDINDRYNKIKDKFFYNINIYKQIQDHDLNINLKKKKALIEQAKVVLTVENLKDAEQQIRAFQNQWMEVGPSPRETYQEIGDEFFAIVRQVYDRVQVHYDGLKEEQVKHLEAKKALIEKAAVFGSTTYETHNAFQKATEEVLALQKEWKTTGFAGKEENEKVWQSFRGECDKFFNAKKTFYDSRKAVQKEAKIKKQDLIDRAKAVQESTDWKKTSDILIGLQKEWKSAGNAGQGDENKLWQQFRAACDTFFNKKKEHFGGMDEQQEENFVKKQELIAAIKAYELSGNRGEDMAKLKEFSASFNTLGFVPRAKIDETIKAYRAALDEKYDALNLNESERRMSSYKVRVSSIKQGENSEGAVKREKRLMYDKIDRLKHRIIQYENNMNFFSGKGADAFKQEVQNKITSAQREIDEIKSKMALLD